jgi:hypothetical protein
LERYLLCLGLVAGLAVARHPVTLNKSSVSCICQAERYNYCKRMQQRIEKLLNDVDAWCSEKRGRQTELAAALGVTRQLLNQWLKRKQDPPSEQTLALIEFLEDPEAFTKAGRGIRK